MIITHFFSNGKDCLKIYPTGPCFELYENTFQIIAEKSFLKLNKESRLRDSPRLSGVVYD